MIHRATILMGPPASGKTTLRHTAYPVSDGWIHLSTDDIVDDYAKAIGKTYADVWSEYVGRATGIMNGLMQDAIKVKRDIVIDRTLMTAKSRGKYIRKLKNAGYTIHLVYMNTAYDEMVRRLDSRAEATGKFIPIKVVDNMISNFEDPLLRGEDGNYIEDWDHYTVYKNGEFHFTRDNRND